MIDYGAFIQRPDGAGRIASWGDYSARWNRIVITGKSDDEGRLTIGIQSPKYPCEPNDFILFSDLTVRRG
jgi:hypothetical protein